MEELAKRRPGCLTRDQINKDLFSGHDGKRVSLVLEQLEKAGQVRREKVPTRGRPTEKFFAV
jgi:predicted transcriptional regulator